MKVVTTTPAPTLPLEEDVLTAFWTACGNGQDRLELLQAIALVKVQRPDDWHTKAMRKAFVPRAYPTSCFSCYHRSRRKHWHHIVTIDNGGSNHVQNLVAVCHVCHKRIHPWLLDEPDDGSFTGPAELIRRIQTGTFSVDPKERLQVPDDDWHPHHARPRGFHDEDGER